MDRNLRKLLAAALCLCLILSGCAPAAPKPSPDGGNALEETGKETDPANPVDPFGPTDATEDDEEYITDVDPVEQQEDEEVADLLEEDEQIHYYARMLILTAQAIQEEIMDQMSEAAAETPDMETLPQIDLMELSEYFGQFQSNYEGLTAALDDETQREKISAFTGEGAEDSLKRYTSRVNTLYNGVGALAQTLLDGGDYTQAYGEVDAAVNDMLDAHNSTVG